MNAAGSVSAYAGRPPITRRAGSALVAVAVNILLVYMLLTLASNQSSGMKVAGRAMTFRLLPDREAETTRAERPRRKATPAPIASRKPQTAPVPSPPAEAPPTPPLNMMILSSEDFAASDIRRMPSHSGERASAAADPGDGSVSADAGGGGVPGIDRLFPADWFRRPTDAELSYYLPKGAPEHAWGEIACQTIARNRVDNCRLIGDSPPGSGMARGVLAAAWQFQVLPPRVNGRPMIGAWVRIRITLIDGKVEASGRGG